MKDFDSTILSIDIGSVAVSIIQLTANYEIEKAVYRYHYGRVDKLLPEILSDFDLRAIDYVVSPSQSSCFSENVTVYDTQSSIISAAKFLHENYEAILIVGAGKFQLMNFDKHGKFIYSSTSTSCAAGTGSFLDQQARRLDLKGAAELSSRADQNTDELPDIASRCSVFAKTDLIHAQQAGYSLESICDSLCKGLARNIADTIFDDEKIPSEIIFAGGVSKNNAVVRHLEQITGTSFIIHELSEFYPSIGAALLHSESSEHGEDIAGIEDVIVSSKKQKEYVFDPLLLKLSSYPDFERGNDIIYSSSRVKHPGKVQIDIYEETAGKRDIFLGIDIGSTSTKAIITDPAGAPLAGFYTYTHGQPLNATKVILDAIRHTGSVSKTEYNILGVGTCGSGRKFIGAIIGADLVLDEITTHARAAHQLNPDTDTIIEIGGQDAKFTLLRNGRVTFSKMNSVCAAGTGSFIEEQALKMNVSLKEYSIMAENAPSPLASDRCTVFMERDINYYFNQGYSRNEILAAVLHSVRDNYLKKVAIEASIGRRICFQGATAKNKALVAAFEAKLNKQIFVSPYCHLTGALGTALLLKEEFRGSSSFRGFDLIEQRISVKTESCGLCNNNCRISVADVDGEKVAYGFLCGRDYETEKFVDKNTSGFDLLKSRQRILKDLTTSSFDSIQVGSDSKARAAGSTVESDSGLIFMPGGKPAEPVIGIPAALHLFEGMTFWKTFFKVLGYRTVSSEKLIDPITTGKRLAGAEFCAPMHAMHGHVKWLADKADYIFIPALLESRKDVDPEKELYCYYTQFSPAVTSLINKEIKDKCLVPLIKHQKGEATVITSLYRSLKVLDPDNIRRSDIRKAYMLAKEADEKKKNLVKGLFRDNFKHEQDLSVVLLGRPYLVLSNSLNNGIPGILGGLGIKTYYQDMLPLEDENDEEMEQLIRSMPWHFASKILRAARYISKSKSLYPVFITAFKCAPDSFVIEYFQRILDAADKPYLILQTDEHDSSVGYETRIEAAVRSFRNHDAENNRPGTGRLDILHPVYKLNKQKTVIFPNWDQIAGRFLAANLRRHGFDTHLVDHTQLGIQKAMATNTGQCLPLNIIAQDYIDYIEKHDLDPSNTILWITETILSCNIRMYPQYIRTILQNHGNGLEKASVYSGEVAHNEISVSITRYAYFAYMLSGLLRRAGCKLRPYELNRGETDAIISKATDMLADAFEGNAGIDETLKKIIPDLKNVKTEGSSKPLVAIFGDFFVRDNDIMNQDLIRTIEKYGGEALVTPYSEFFKLIAGNVLRRRRDEGKRLEIMGYRALLVILKQLEKKYFRYFEDVLGKPKGAKPLELEKNLVRYNIDKDHSGESFDNILKIYHIIESYPDISLFVQTNPAFCCPSLITEAMKKQIRNETGIPIVTITYDGTTEQKNDIIAPYLLNSQ